MNFTAQIETLNALVKSEIASLEKTLLIAELTGEDTQEIKAIVEGMRFVAYCDVMMSEDPSDTVSGWVNVDCLGTDLQRAANQAYIRLRDAMEDEDQFEGEMYFVGVTKAWRIVSNNLESWCEG